MSAHGKTLCVCLILVPIIIYVCFLCNLIGLVLRSCLLEEGDSNTTPKNTNDFMQMEYLCGRAGVLLMLIFSWALWFKSKYRCL